MDTNEDRSSAARGPGFTVGGGAGTIEWVGGGSRRPPTQESSEREYRDSGSDLRYHWHDESSKYDHLSSQRLGLAHYESVVIKVGLREWEIHIYRAIGSKG